MFDQLKIFEQLKEIFDEETASRLTRVFASVFEPLESAIQQADRSVERQEAAERARAVDARFDRIDATLERITQIGQRTDERLDTLGARVEDLAAAQQRTEQRLEALGARVDDLTAAQARTWEEVTILKDDMRDVRQQLGGLSHTVGYELENKAYVSLPRLLEHDHGIVVDESLVRRFVADRDDNPMELNIVGGAHRGEEKLRIVGEAKAQLSKNAVDNFLRKRLGRLPEDERTVVPVLITHMISEHDAEDYAREKGVLLYYSYQL
ncbi:MAG: hypothetical protein ACLFMV_13130 [Spirochaetaceae bacterium]